VPSFSGVRAALAALGAAPSSAQQDTGAEGPFHILPAATPNQGQTLALE